MVILLLIYCEIFMQHNYYNEDVYKRQHQPFQHFVQLHFNDSFTIQLIIITDTATTEIYTLSLHDALPI